jgi:hypothetical protein
VPIIIMYGPSYGLGAAAGFESPPPADESSSSPFNPAHHQPHLQQLPQHLMYNPQAYGAAPQQPMYDGSTAAVMGGSPEAMDAGMAHLHQAGGKYGLSRLPSSSLLLLLLSLSLLLFQWLVLGGCAYLYHEPPVRCLILYCF